MSGQMEVGLRETGKIMQLMGRESLLGMMKNTMMESGKIAR